MLLIVILVIMSAYTPQAKYNGSCCSCIERRKNASHALCKLQVGFIIYYIFYSALIIYRIDIFFEIGFSSYNADFDGDEINVHFPQDEISRAEAYNIVNANEQYIVPTRGDTVRGLIQVSVSVQNITYYFLSQKLLVNAHLMFFCYIPLSTCMINYSLLAIIPFQDHIVSAVLLTMKNTFLTRAEFSQLLYGSGVFAGGSGSLAGNHSRKVSIVDSEGLVESVLPTVWKPVPLWTGKQVKIFRG